ncbi:MAG: hypothetical protein HY820_41005 [Acidobacteria bacterium]|nr:hypothetical protein [Acidobacteriota bacterium]
MCRIATLGLLTLLTGVSAVAQSTVPARNVTPAGALRADGPRFDWRRIGTSAVELALPSAASGPVQRVWYSANGDQLFALTASGNSFETNDFETWRAAGVAPPAQNAQVAETLPEGLARVVRAGATRSYGIGRFVYRSDDGGTNWTNVTGYRDRSILGAPLSDVAVSPRDPDEVTVSNLFGIWRSMDGGITWAGLNQGLPNFPADRLLAVPFGLRPARVEVRLASEALDLEWAPGERNAWRPAQSNQGQDEQIRREAISQQLGVSVTTVATQGDYVYAGTADGRIFTSANHGQTWGNPSGFAGAGAVNAIYVSPVEARVAVAAFAVRAGETRTVRVARTSTGGRIWDDASSNLPWRGVNGVTADLATGSIYAAMPDGVYYTSTDLANLTFAAAWQRVSGGLPDGAVMDVKLDDAGNQLFALVQGHGLFGTLAPHRLRNWAVVNAADGSSVNSGRPAAPGSLLSILGARLDRVRTGTVAVPLLSATANETQVQVPFEASGASLALTLETNLGSRVFPVPLAPVSPAIFVDRDGSPLLLDADSGTPLDASAPARPGMRVQILATGLGAVDPAWPTGVAAPAENTPRVVAPVTVQVDREPVEVLRATLAPGYIGFYLIEIQLPQIVNAGPAELFLQAGPGQSNRVRLYLSPTAAASH